MLIITTGGTIDKTYNELSGELEFSADYIEKILRKGRAALDCQIKKLFAIDSLEMTAKQRQQILQTCRETPEQQIVITHGTDTMCETAEFLGQNIFDKTVVLVGAMIPFSVNGSDAEFNVGAAVAATQLLPSGVYIAMNGRVFKRGEVRKDRSLGKFIEK